MLHNQYPTDRTIEFPAFSSIQKLKIDESEVTMHLIAHFLEKAGNVLIS